MTEMALRHETNRVKFHKSQTKKSDSTVTHRTISLASSNLCIEWASQSLN